MDLISGWNDSIRYRRVAGYNDINILAGIDCIILCRMH